MATKSAPAILWVVFPLNRPRMHPSGTSKQRVQITSKLLYQEDVQLSR